MSEFLSATLGFPTIVFSILLAVVLVYWLLAIVGLVDFGESDIDVDIGNHADGPGDDLGTIASYVVAFGLTGVPFSSSCRCWSWWAGPSARWRPSG